MSDNSSQYESIARSQAHLEGALLPVLHLLQDQFGFIPEDAVPVVARVLNLSRAEVHGVITFYRDFKQQPAGRKRVQVCRAEACCSIGGHELANHARKSLGIDFEETRDDGSVSLESVYCLGLCACAPAIKVDDELHGRVSPALFDELVKL
jgi:formate dehydrogenase subunit gamma